MLNSDKRFSLSKTRVIINAILDGKIEEAEFEIDEYFRFQIPTSLGDIDSNLLIPANIWKDQEVYRETAVNLVKKFQDNFSQYDLGDTEVKEADAPIRDSFPVP